MDNYSECDFREYHEIVTETKKAWLLSIVDDKDRWFPKSICELDKRAQMLILPLWLADKIWGTFTPIKKLNNPPSWLDAGPEPDYDEMYNPYEFH